MSRIEDRSYGGKLFRPAPEVHLEEDGIFGVIATPWGNRSAAKKTIDTLKDYVLSARQDMEATSPFQKLTCLSPLANSLRVGVMLANDLLYREDNRAEYSSGVEVLAFVRLEDELAFAQVGLPHLFLARQGLPWIPLSVQLDLSTELSTPGNLMPPLPHNLIGLNTATNMSINSIKVRASDQLIFLSHSVPSSPLFQMPFEQTGVDNICRQLAREHADLPFWIGVLPL